MNELELLREQWSEQMFEQRANGIETESFEDWNHKRMARMEFFDTVKSEREKAKKDADRMAWFNEWNNAESDAESVAEALAS